MLRGYAKWNHRAVKILWGVLIVAVLASLPFIYERVRTESSAKKVEIVFDYRDLVEISAYQRQPREFINAELAKMLEAGIRSLSVYETTLIELQQSRRIDVYNSRDAAILTQKPADPAENLTYILFADEVTRQKLQPTIERAYGQIQVRTAPWQYGGRSGLVIYLTQEEAWIKPLGMDSMTLDDLRNKGFQLVGRLSNRHQPFVEADMDRLLSELSRYGIKTIIGDGDTLPGYSTSSNDTDDLKTMGELLQKHGMGLAAIELIKSQQKGFATLAKLLDYNVFRLHSYTEADADKLTTNITDEERENLIRGVSDRFVLAVKDRNIRMIFLNARASRNMEKATYQNPLDAIYKSLKGIEEEEGAISRIEKAGFMTGQAHAFTRYEVPAQSLLKLLVIIGSAALIALTIAAFINQLLLAVFVLGTFGSLGLFVLAPDLLYKLLALGVSICAPTLAMIYAINRIRQVADRPLASKLGFTYNLFIKTTAVSAVGVVFTVALLNHITYTIVLNQFTGVKALSLLPIVLAGIYLLFFSKGVQLSTVVQNVRKLLSSSITVLWVLLAAAIFMVISYYLSRTGNQGQAPAYELLFRSFLENTLGIRPRTKEFLFAHPLFLLGAYLAVKYRIHALYIFIAGVIGQISIVSTFTHLHTPLVISLMRSAYGILFGLLIGTILIGLWELGVRGWKKWEIAPIKS